MRAVAQIAEQQGMRAEIYSSTLRVYVPSNIAMNMTASQAKELAGTLYSRIGSGGAVRIKSEGGQTLAEADVWGIR